MFFQAWPSTPGWKIGSLCSSFAQNGTRDPYRRASVVQNRSDAATGEEHLCGIVAAVYCDSMSLLASKLLTLYPSE